MINNQNLAVLSEKVARLEGVVANSTEASGISYDNTDSGLTADDVQGAIDEVLTSISTKIDARVALGGTLSGNVLEVLGNLPVNKITFYPQSNNPTNAPTGCQWGCYVIFKASNYSSIIYWDNAHLAFAYAIGPDVTSITWTIL